MRSHTSSDYQTSKGSRVHRRRPHRHNRHHWERRQTSDFHDPSLFPTSCLPMALPICFVSALYRAQQHSPYIDYWQFPRCRYSWRQSDSLLSFSRRDRGYKSHHSTLHHKCARSNRHHLEPSQPQHHGPTGQSLAVHADPLPSGL